MRERNERKKEVKLCLDMDSGCGQYVSYIGAVGCFLFAFIGFATYFFPQKPLAHFCGIPLALVFGIVAVCLGVLLLDASRQGEK